MPLDKKDIQRTYDKRSYEKKKMAKALTAKKCAAKGCRWKAMPNTYTCLSHNDIGGKWYGGSED